MVNLSIPLSEGAFSALHLNPVGLAREMRLVAAIQWNAQGRISQDMATEIAGVVPRQSLMPIMDNAANVYEYACTLFKKRDKVIEW